MSDQLEKLKLYHIYTDLYYYTYMITEKYPKHEKLSLVSDIKNTTYNGLYNLINAQKEFDIKKD